MRRNLVTAIALIAGFLFAESAGAQTERWVIDKTFSVRLYLDVSFRNEFTAAEETNIENRIFSALQTVYRQQLAFDLRRSTTLPLNNVDIGTLNLKDPIIDWMKAPGHVFRSSRTIDILLLHKEVSPSVGSSSSNDSAGYTLPGLGGYVSTRLPDTRDELGNVISRGARRSVDDIVETAVHEVGHYFGHPGLGRLVSAGTCLRERQPMQIMCHYSANVSGRRSINNFTASDIVIMRNGAYTGNVGDADPRHSPKRTLDCYDFGNAAGAAARCDNYCGVGTCIFGQGSLNDPTGAALQYQACLDRVDSCRSSTCSRMCVN
jgi:hypothetical protein